MIKIKFYQGNNNKETSDKEQGIKSNHLDKIIVTHNHKF
jgi:hypothetical protein